jgi:hypothetical protein
VPKNKGSSQSVESFPSTRRRTKPEASKTKQGCGFESSYLQTKLAAIFFFLVRAVIKSTSLDR